MQYSLNQSSPAPTATAGHRVSIPDSTLLIVGCPVGLRFNALAHVIDMRSTAVTLTLEVTATTGIDTVNISSVDIMPHAVLYFS